MRFAGPFVLHSRAVPLPGFPLTTVMVMFVTYCLVQLIKESERRQALIDDPDPIPPPPPAPPAVDPSQAADGVATAPPPPLDPSKEKAE